MRAPYFAVATALVSAAFLAFFYSRALERSDYELYVTFLMTVFLPHVVSYFVAGLGLVQLRTEPLSPVAGAIFVWAVTLPASAAYVWVMRAIWRLVRRPS